MVLLRCGGCGESVSEWALHCSVCLRASDDAAVVPADVERLVRTVGALLLGRAPGAAAREPQPVRARTGATVERGARSVPTDDTSHGRHARRSQRAAGRVAAAAAVALLVAVALAAGSVVAGGSGTTPARKVRAVVPPGTVLSWTSAGALVSSTAAGSGVVALPQRNGTGLVPAGDGHLLATGSGVELAGPSLVPTGASVPFDGEAGGWRAVGFADRGAALAATQTAPDGSDQAEVVTFSGQPPVELGEAEEVAADPAAPGIYAVLAGGTDGTSVERRDAGQRAVGVATAAGLLVDLHEVSASNEASALHALAARSVVVSVLPDPTGRRVALTIAGVGAAGLAGIVVVDRAGGLVGSVRLSGGFAGAPAWSPDGTSLVYATTATLRRGSRTAVTVWRPGERPSTDVLPASVSEALGDCIWAGSTSVVCADAVSAGPIRTWVYGSPGGPFTVVSGPGVPFAWLAAAPSVPVTPRLWPREPVLAPQPATASTVTPFQKATWSRISLAASLGSG